MPLLPDRTRTLERYVNQLMDESDRLTDDDRQRVTAARNAIAAARSSSTVGLPSGARTMLPAAEEQITDIWNRYHPDEPCELRRPFWRRLRG